MLTAEDMAVLANTVKDPDAWISHVFAYCAEKEHDARQAESNALDMIFAKCRRDVHVTAYRAKKNAPEYQSRGPLPSAATQTRVTGAVIARDKAIADAETAKFRALILG